MVGEAPLPALDSPFPPPQPPASTHSPPTWPSVHPPNHHLPTPLPTTAPTQPSAGQFTYLPTLQSIILTAIFPVHLGSNSFAHPPVHPAKYPSIHSGEGGSTHPLTNLIHPSNQLPMYPLTNLTIHLPAHLPIHLPTYPFIYAPSSHLSLHSSAITLSHPFRNPSIHPSPTHPIIPFPAYGGTIYPPFHHPSCLSSIFLPTCVSVCTCISLPTESIIPRAY